jgi:cell division transport system permease protein
MLDRLEFILSETFSALRRNPLMTISAVNTAAIALVILGGLGYAYLSLRAQLEQLPEQFQITFSVTPGTELSEISETAEDLRRLDGVARVVLLPKAVEWEKWRKKQGMYEDTRDIENPLPDQLLVTLSDLAKAEGIRSHIESLPTYFQQDGIRDAIEERRRVTALLEFVRWSGLLLGVITFFTAGALILNSVHLTVIARQQEIRIMRLVGATNSRIRWPFLLEGGMQGAMGGILAGLLLWLLAWYLSKRSSEITGPLLSTGEQFPAIRVTLFLAGVGAILGMLAAAVSVRNYLRAHR